MIAAEQLDTVDVEADVNAIAHLDFAPPCSIRVEFTANIFGHRIPLGTSPQCPDAAVAAMRCRVCSVTGLVCERHRAAIASDENLLCGHCGATGPGLQLIEFTPLPGGGA